MTCTRIRTVALAAVLFSAATASAQTTWQATATNTWNTAGNWSAGLPGVGTVAVFSSAGATQFAMNNDIAGLTLAGLTVNNLGTGHSRSTATRSPSAPRPASTCPPPPRT